MPAVLYALGFRQGSGSLQRDCLQEFHGWKSSQSSGALDYDEVSAASNKEKP